MAAITANSVAQKLTCRRDNSYSQAIDANFHRYPHSVCQTCAVDVVADGHSSLSADLTTDRTHCHFSAHGWVPETGQLAIKPTCDSASWLWVDQSASWLDGKLTRFPYSAKCTEVTASSVSVVLSCEIVFPNMLLKQGRNTRNAELTRLADHIRNVYVKRDRTWIVLFPEGGFLCNRKESSQAYVTDQLYHVWFVDVLRRLTIGAITLWDTSLPTLEKLGTKCIRAPPISVTIIFRQAQCITSQVLGPWGKLLNLMGKGRGMNAQSEWMVGANNDWKARREVGGKGKKSTSTYTSHMVPSIF